MSIAHEPIFQWMAQFAYEPGMVYTGLIGMMLLSAVGLPLPEEVTLVSVGILVFMGGNPHLFPPPFDGAPVVNVHTAAAVAFFAVFMSDFLIYMVGRKFGRKILRRPTVQKLISESMMQRVEEWTQKYGSYACGIFRFTPGIRFPGHLACGIMKFPIWKFMLIDGVAAMISVPTQIYLLAHYGEDILTKLRQFKLIVLAVLVVIGIYFLIKKVRARILAKRNQAA